MIASSLSRIRPALASLRMYSSDIGQPVSRHVAPVRTTVPRLGSKPVGGEPTRTVKRNELSTVLISGKTNACLPVLVASMKDLSRGTCAPEQAGFGLATVRAQS